MPSLSQILSNTAETTFSFSGFDFKVEYAPAAITEEVYAKLQLFTSMGNADQIASGFKGLNEILVQVVKSWDLYEDDEQTRMVELKVERLSSVPIGLRVSCLFAVMRDFRPEQIAPQIPS